jgi:hypothetical protein
MNAGGTSPTTRITGNHPPDGERQTEHGDEPDERLQHVDERPGELTRSIQRLLRLSLLRDQLRRLVHRHSRPLRDRVLVHLMQTRAHDVARVHLQWPGQLTEHTADQEHRAEQDEQGDEPVSLREPRSLRLQLDETRRNERGEESQQDQSPELHPGETDQHRQTLRHREPDRQEGCRRIRRRSSCDDGIRVCDSVHPIDAIHHL